MQTMKSITNAKFDKELVMLVHARCNCSICTAEKNKIKQKMGEKQYYKICDQIKHSFTHSA